MHCSVSVNPGDLPFLRSTPRETLAMPHGIILHGNLAEFGLRKRYGGRSVKCGSCQWDETDVWE
jgi:hypothetical protein